MEQALQFTGLCVVGALLALTVRRGSPETALLLSIAAIVLVALGLADSMGQVLSFLKELGERSGVARLCIIHRNIPAMLANIMSVLSKEGANVEHMTNKSRGEYAYTMIDVDSTISDGLRLELIAIDNVIRVRILQMH